MRLRHFVSILSISALVASCKKLNGANRSELSGGGTQNPYDDDDFGPDSGRPSDGFKVIYEEYGRYIWKEGPDSFLVKCNDGSYEKAVSAVRIDSGDFCKQDKLTPQTDQTNASTLNAKHVASMFLSMKGFRSGTSLVDRRTPCSLEVIPEGSDYKAVFRYVFKGTPYEETVDSNVFKMSELVYAMDAKVKPLSKMRSYNVGFDRYGNLSYFSLESWSGEPKGNCSFRKVM